MILAVVENMDTEEGAVRWNSPVTLRALIQQASSILCDD